MNGAPEPPFRLTSIVIPVLNQLPLLEAALESIERCTPEPHEIVIIDNGSRPDVREYLSARPVRLIVNPENRGFARAINQGMSAAAGDVLVWLNSDVRVTPGWLRILHEALAVPGVGLVGPYTNNISGGQKLEVDYERCGGPEGVAAVLRDTRFGALQVVNRLVGFCLAFTRRTADAVGALDERFGMGNFEDDDYCLRARLLGLKCVIAEDAFVHHEGSATFKGERMDQNALMDHNLELFRDKWRTPDLALLPSLVRRIEQLKEAA